METLSSIPSTDANEITDLPSVEHATLSNIEMLANLIRQKHNPGLVVPTAAPNGNMIYHLYPDGEITFQKGGFAYLKRSVFTDVGPNRTFGKRFVELFPVVFDGQHGRYVIANSVDVHEVRALMAVIAAGSAV